MPSQPVRGSLAVTRTVNIKASRAGGRRKQRSKRRVTSNRSRARPTVVNATDDAVSSESSSDGAVAASSNAQPLDCADHTHTPTFDDSCLSSPEAAWHGIVDASYDTYRSRLMAAPAHRCVSVADNKRGVQCLAVATGIQAASGVQIKVPRHQNSCSVQSCSDVNVLCTRQHQS